MLTNFEEITHELTDEELKILPSIVKHLKQKIGVENAITSKAVVDAYKNGNTAFKMTGARWRKIIQYIRINSLIPLLISTSKGYYIATTEEEIKNYLESLKQRITSMTSTYDALEHQFRTSNFYKK